MIRCHGEPGAALPRTSCLELRDLFAIEFPLASFARAPACGKSCALDSADTVTDPSPGLPHPESALARQKPATTPRP